MSTGNPTPDNIRKEEFKLATEAEMLEQHEKMVLGLTPFLGELLARQTADYFLGEARIMNNMIKLLLEEEKVSNECSYNGRYFVSKNTADYFFTAAPSGYYMLQYINTNLKSYFTKKLNGNNFTAEETIKNLQSMIDDISRNLISQTYVTSNCYAENGRIKASMADYTVIRVLGNKPEEIKSEALKNIRRLTQEAINNQKIKKDGFFQDLERQMGEK
jgi:hypothetical protein